MAASKVVFVRPNEMSKKKIGGFHFRGSEKSRPTYVSPNKRILAASDSRMVGLKTPRPYDLFLNKALDGQLAASRPFARQANPGQQAEGPTMFVAAPVKSTNGVIIAVLCL